MLYAVQWKLHRTVWVVVTAHRRDALDALNEQVRTDDVARAVVNFRAALHAAGQGRSHNACPVLQPGADT